MFHDVELIFNVAELKFNASEHKFNVAEHKLLLGLKTFTSNINNSFF